jgi:hypothetical protein
VNVNWKLATAFATGAVLASGIVYFAVRPVSVGSEDSPKLVVTPAIAPKPVAPPFVPAPVAEIASAPAPPARPPDRISRVPIREKPSPMPPPVRHQREIIIARNDPPTPPPPAPAPVESKPAPPPVIVAAPAPPQNVPVQNVSLPAPAPNVETRVPHTVTLATGTLLSARMGETLSSAHNQPGDTFLATLTQPLVIDGFIIAERGARLEGRVVEAGASHLGISVVRLATADGQNIRIRTEPFVKQAGSSTGTDAAKIGAGAAIGAVIGAVAGGGKGAAIGAGAGGVVGAGDVLLTRGQAAEIKVETRVSFRVQDSILITERLD